MRFSDLRDHRRGERRRQAKAAEAQLPVTPVTHGIARRVPGAIKPTVQHKAHGRRQHAYELDPYSCDERDLARLAEEEDLDLGTLAADEKAA